MKNFLRIIFFFIQFSISLDAYAQWFKIDSLKIVPAIPIKNDGVSIFLYTRTYGTGVKVYFNHNVNGNNINVQGCYTVLGAATSTYHKDTILLGKLAIGEYYINITSYRSSSDIICDAYDSLKNYDTFIVNAPVAVDEYQVETIALSPNPVKNILNINTRVPIKRACIYSILGKPLEVLVHEQSTWDISSLPPGIYFLYVDTDKGKYIERFVKE